MRNLIAFCTFQLLAIAALAQDGDYQLTGRGNFVIGSRIGFSAARSEVNVQSEAGSIKGDGGTASQFNLSPNIGYFFADHFVLGIAMDWLKIDSRAGIDLSGGGTPPQESHNNNLLFGPFMRVFVPAGENKAFFLGATMGFGNSQNQFIVDNETQSVDNSLLTIGVGPGFTIYSGDGLALEALVKYSFAKSTSSIDIQGIQRTSQTWTNALDFSVGLQYYFGGFTSVNNRTRSNQGTGTSFF